MTIQPIFDATAHPSSPLPWAPGNGATNRT